MEKSIAMEDITNATNKLLARSDKFRAFFSRAELEMHVAMALYETRAANLLPSPPVTETQSE